MCHPCTSRAGALPLPGFRRIGIDALTAPVRYRGSPLNPLAGIALKVISALAFTIMSAGIKAGGADSPTGQVGFCGWAFAVGPLGSWLAWQGRLVDAVRTHDLRARILRGII